MKKILGLTLPQIIIGIIASAKYCTGPEQYSTRINPTLRRLPELRENCDTVDPALCRLTIGGTMNYCITRCCEIAFRGTYDCYGRIATSKACKTLSDTICGQISDGSGNDLTDGNGNGDSGNDQTGGSGYGSVSGQDGSGAGYGSGSGSGSGSGQGNENNLTGGSGSGNGNEDSGNDLTGVSSQEGSGSSPGGSGNRDSGSDQDGREVSGSGNRDSGKSTKKSLIQINIKELLNAYTHHCEIDDSLDRICKNLIYNLTRWECTSRTTEESTNIWREEKLREFSKLVYEFILALSDLYKLTPRDVILKNEKYNEKLFADVFEIYVSSVISTGCLVNDLELAGSINGNNLVLKFGDYTSKIELKKPNTPERIRSLASFDDELDLDESNLDTLLMILEEEIGFDLAKGNDQDKLEKLREKESLIKQHIKEVIRNRDNEALKGSLEVTQMYRHDADISSSDPHKSSSDPVRSISLLLRDSVISTKSSKRITPTPIKDDSRALTNKGPNKMMSTVAATLVGQFNDAAEKLATLEPSPAASR